MLYILHQKFEADGQGRRCKFALNDDFVKCVYFDSMLNGVLALHSNWKANFMITLMVQSSDVICPAFKFIFELESL